MFCIWKSVPGLLAVDTQIINKVPVGLQSIPATCAPDSSFFPQYAYWEKKHYH